MKEFFRFIIPYMKNHKRWFLWVNVFGLLTALSEVSIPIWTAYLLDEIILLQQKQRLFVGFLILLALILVNWGTNAALRLTTTYLGQNILEDIRQHLFDVIQHQELPFYEKESPGQILSRTIGELMTIKDMLRWGYRLVVLFLWMLCFSIIYMSTISLVLGLLFLIIFPFMFLLINQVSKETKDKFYQERFIRGKLNEFTAENLSGIKTIKSFGREFEQILGYERRYENYNRIAFETIDVRVKVTEGMVFILSFLIIGLLFVGGAFLSQGRITPGEFSAFLLLVSSLSVPGRWVGFLGMMLFVANAATIRLNEVLQAPNTILTTQGTHELTTIKGEIEFVNVSFGLHEDYTILKDISLHIPVGQKLLILGPNGAGKSTLVNLLSRFYDPDQGQILIDGIDIRDFSLRALRQNIGFVHQEAFLFTLSIHDNIAFGIPDASREAVIRAAKIAQIHDFIMELEKGYDTIIGERGVTLSGGQRQRMAIARTILKDPPILIFDDSVSAIDPETESLIQSSLMDSAQNRTTIIISQRSSSIQYVDQIMFMTEGSIIQKGDDATLRTQEGPYQTFIHAVEGQIDYLDWTAESADEEIISVSPTKDPKNKTQLQNN